MLCFIMHSTRVACPPSHQVARVTSGEHAGKVVVRVSERYFRPAEVSTGGALGSASA